MYKHYDMYMNVLLAMSCCCCYYLQNLSAMKLMFVWLEAMFLLWVVWRCAVTEHGELFATRARKMMTGQTWMLLWCVVSWDITTTVSVHNIDLYVLRLYVGTIFCRGLGSTSDWSGEWPCCLY